MKIKSYLSICLLTFSVGCKPSVTVSRIDRHILADSTMRPDFDTVTYKMNEHAFFSREASRGGGNAGGGGCGCN